MPILPNVKELGIAFRDESGIQNTPWHYKFDQGKIVSISTANGRVPDILCYERCYPRDALAFVNVSLIQFGSDPGIYSKTIEIDYSAQDFLEQTCLPRIESDCPPFSFEIPDEWTDVYSVITLADGTVIPEKRFPLRN